MPTPHGTEVRDSQGQEKEHRLAWIYLLESLPKFRSECTPEGLKVVKKLKLRQSRFEALLL